MSTKPENTFIASVHKHLPPKQNPYREKMNNPYSGGTPDVYYSGNGADMWVEYKFLPRTPQRGVVWLCKPDVKKPMLSELQRQWLRDRHEEGRVVHVVVGCPAGGVVLSDLEWEAPIPVALFSGRIQERKALALWITQKTMR